MKKQLYWRALSTSKADGYGYASYKISSGLKDVGVNIVQPGDIFMHPHYQEIDVYVTAESGILFKPNPNIDRSDILVNNCLPVDYKIQECYNIGFSYWETTKVPSSWVPKLKSCNEVWTTSSWAKDVFKENTGIDNVFSFKLGIDDASFWPSGEVSDGPFTFLHVGSPSSRKNTQMAVDAFIKTFGHNKDCRLIVKSIGPPDARIYSGGMNHGSITNHDRISVIDYEISEQELGDLYRSSHCLIYPTMGEGWGMIPFNSIGCGNPTICTNATACSEYAELSIPLDFSWSNEKMTGIYDCGGQWAKPDFDDLCDKMVWVVDNYNEVKNKTMKGSEIIHRDFSWDSVVKEYADRLCLI